MTLQDIVKDSETLQTIKLDDVSEFFNMYEDVILHKRGRNYLFATADGKFGKLERK